MTVPLFSSRVGHALLSQSPRHAIEPTPDEPSDIMDLGTVVHGCLLTGDANVLLVDAKDWRTAGAKSQRALARSEGKTPLLAHKWAEVQAMVKAARHQLERVEPPTPFVGGEAEKSLYFDLDGVACRATPDWVSSDHRLIVDLKTTGASAHPGAWAKTVWGNGNAIQNALYRMAVKVVYGTTAEFKWVVQETYQPHALSVVALDPEAAAFADTQLDAALAGWKRCLDTGDWPAYPTRTCFAEVPAYLQTQWLEREYFDAYTRQAVDR